MAVSHTDCDYSREQVQISLPSVVKQPLHVALGEQEEGEKKEGEGKILMKGSKSQRHRHQGYIHVHVAVHVHVDRRSCKGQDLTLSQAVIMHIAKQG